MSYRFLITGVLHGGMVGIGLSVGTYLSDTTVGVPYIKLGFGVAAALVLAGYVSFLEIKRTEHALQSRGARGNYAYLFQATADTTRPSEKDQRSLMIAALSPISGMTITLFPFVFQGVLLTPFFATLGAIILGTAFLFAFGSWLALVTHRPWYIVGSRLATFGLLVAGVNVILP